MEDEYGNKTVVQSAFAVHTHAETRNAILVLMGLAIDKLMDSDHTFFGLTVCEEGADRDHTYHYTVSLDTKLGDALRFAKSVAVSILGDTFASRGSFMLEIVATETEHRLEFKDGRRVTA